MKSCMKKSGILSSQAPLNFSDLRVRTAKSRRSPPGSRDLWSPAGLRRGCCGGVLFKKSAMFTTMILLTCSTGLGAASSVTQEVNALVGAKNLNALVRVFQDAVHAEADDTRAQLCTAIISHVENEALPNSFSAELLTLIVRFGGAESVDALTRLLSHKDAVLRSRGILGLQKSPSESAAVVLRTALTDASDPERQAILIHALTERGGSACLPAFITLAASTNTQVRNMALRAVALTSDTPRKVLFQSGIQQASMPARMDAINAYLAHADRLAEIGKKRDAVSIYRELVTLGGFQKRNALMGLARVDGAEQLVFIQKNLEGKNKQDLAVLNSVFSPMFGENADIASVYGNISAKEPTLKAGLLGVLGTYADPANLDTVLTAVDDPNDFVREAALTALGHFDHARATDTLIAAVVFGRNPDVAVRSIEKNPSKTKIAGPLKKALPASSGPARLALIRLLGNCPKAECIPVLLETLSDTDPAVRVAVLEALTRVSDRLSFGPIVDFLADEPDRKVRFKALALLSALVDISGASTAWSTHVVSRLTEGAGPGRVELIGLLPSVSVAATRDAEMKILGEALASDDKNIRRAAIRAMQEWPDSEAVLDVLLRTAAKRPDSADGILALRAYTTQLERLGDKRSASVRESQMTDHGNYVDGGNINLTANRDGGAVTVSMWVRPAVLSGDNRLFGQLRGAATQQGALRVAGDGHLEVWAATAWPQIAPAGTLAADVWTHLALVWTGNSVQAYVDGVAQGRATANFDFGAANGQFGIGAPFLTEYGQAFDGVIDDVAIFALALDADQIEILADRSKTRTSLPEQLPAPVQYWPFDDKGGGTVTVDADPTESGAAKDMLQHYRKGLDVAVTRPEKSGLLNGLSRHHALDALKTTLMYFDDADVKEEAMLAAYTIAAVLGKSQAETVRPALEKIIANTSNQKLKADAASLLKSTSSEPAHSAEVESVKPSASSARSGATRDFFPYVPSISDTSKRSLDEQAALFRELGYAGSGELAQELGFPGFGHPKGVTVAQRVASLEKEGLRLILATGVIRLDAAQPIDMAKVKEIMPALAKHKTVLGVVLSGNRKADHDAKAVDVLTQMADIAKPHGVEIAIYPHAGDYTQTVEEAARVTAKVNRPQQVGVIFNLFHWMSVDRARDLKTALTQAAPWLKVVNINGSAKNKATVLPLDQGDFDLSPIITILDEIDYGGPVGLFCYNIGGDARTHLATSMTQWKAMTAQSDAAATQAPKGATVLFDGTDTSLWMKWNVNRIPTKAQLANPAPSHYKIVDDALEVTPGGHLVTKKLYQSYRLHAEVWLPSERVNSGIWSQVRYGVEIRGKRDSGTKYAMGALYGIKAPDTDAAGAARTWQTLDITFTAARFGTNGKKTANAKVTVFLNGVKVQDEAEYPGTSPTLSEPEGPTPGPIVLENHGDPVRFRNIWVVTI
jgi:sugar phosphate isomerase/epimerase/HEAT repeat protein